MGEETVVSPLPGGVLAVNVKVGDKVNEGDILLVIEAMKMENEIYAPRNAIVKELKVAPGASVEIGDLLLVLE